ncbi:hypothetical protein QVD17_18828 [Tagetes erecta]|uniref:Uncharacterized protein n=1 Tax=Tagetes erecta TaxID=13708 RepID=A0AAD8KIG4_TARER|nr:hypothetical protein QVD17_18828 [Tagetes erecta]
MEGSCSTSHFRSISLPSRLPDPAALTSIETKIKEVKARGDLVCSSETIQHGLVGLAELYVGVNELLQSPHTRQVLSRGTLVQDALEGSVVLLDSCNVLKELIMLMKENVQILQSALRRKGGNLTVVNEIATYLRSRRRVKKSIIKSLETLKSIEKKMTLISFPDVDHHASRVSKVLGEVNALTIALFKTLLVFVSPKSKPVNGVQLLSKLGLKSTTSTHDKKVVVNEVQTVDMITMSLYKSTRNNKMKDADVHMTIGKLQILDVCIDGYEDALNCLFRIMIQNRASLLNIVVC